MTQVSLTEVRLHVPSTHLMLELLGERDVFLRRVERSFEDAQVIVRGNEVLIVAPTSSKKMCRRRPGCSSKAYG